MPIALMMASLRSSGVMTSDGYRGFEGSVPGGTIPPLILHVASCDFSFALPPSRPPLHPGVQGLFSPRASCAILPLAITIRREARLDDPEPTTRKGTVILPRRMPNMGYSHYRSLDARPTLSRWNAFTETVRRIVALPAFIGRLCWEYDELERPPQIDAQVIRFNGKVSEGYETFCFERVAAPPRRGAPEGGARPRATFVGPRGATTPLSVPCSSPRPRPPRLQHLHRRGVVRAGLGARPSGLRRGRFGPRVHLGQQALLRLRAGLRGARGPLGRLVAQPDERGALLPLRRAPQ